MDVLAELETIQKTVAAVIAEIKGAAAPIGAVTLENWLAEWLEIYKRPTLKPRSVLSLSACINKYLVPSLGAYQLAELDSPTIQRALNAIPYPRQREISYTLLGACLKKAVQLGKLERDPMNAVERPKSQTQRGKAFTLQEQRAFLNAARGSPLEAVYTAYLLTGCRLRELLAVRWSDVDFSAGVLRIHGTKTESAARAVPLCHDLRMVLLTLPRSGPFVFDYKPDYIDRHFQKLCRQAGLSGFTVHSLRHTFATRCMERGVNVKVLQSWLGHSDVKMTLGTYSHVQAAFSTEEAQKLRDIL